MRTRTLALLLSGCALLGAYPIFVWAIARFGWIDQRFVASLGALAFTLPIALAAAALALVAHGLRVNTELYDLLELDAEADDAAAEEARELAIATVTAPATAAAGPNIVTVSGGTAVASAAPAAPAVESAPDVAEPEAEAPKRGGKYAVAERKNQGFKDGKQSKKQSRARRTAKSMGNRGKYAAKGAVGRKIRDGIRMPRF